MSNSVFDVDVLFLDFLIEQVSQYKIFLLRVYKLKCLCIEPRIDSPFQADPLLIQTSIMYKISRIEFSSLILRFITVFVNELKQTGANSISSLCLYFLTKRLQ